MENYFAGNALHPYHISIGAILRNNKGEVACHHFLPEDDNVADDFYILMRETLEPHETVEQALARGLMEEFGATATFGQYMGSLLSWFERPEAKGIQIEKTVLYFLMDLVDYDDAKRMPTDREMHAINEWQMPAFLIKKIQARSKRIGKTGPDESIILQRLPE